MASNTALSYQMMIEEKIMTAMINAEQRGFFSFACSYGLSYLKFLQADISKLPKLPLVNTEQAKQNAYVIHYFNILDLITSTASKKIAEVREKYGKKGNSDLLN